VRAETNARIAEILTPEQRPIYERLLSESGSRGQSAAGRVYGLESGEPKPIDVRLGLTDGTSTEIVSGLAEGNEVITGTLDTRGGGQGASGGLPRGRFF
jgi:HlyD family secretion protein